MQKTPAKTGKESFFFGVIKMSALSTVRQFSEKQPAFTENSLRAFIFNEHRNGLAKSGAVKRVGRKVLIDDAKFMDWIEAQNQRGAA